MCDFEADFLLAENANNKRTCYDRDVDYDDARIKLIDHYNFLIERLHNPKYSQPLTLRKIIFTLIAMTQLRNGSRISEAVRAFYSYNHKQSFLPSVKVKISKSDAQKTNKSGQPYKPKARLRDIKFQKFVDITDIQHLIFTQLKKLDFKKLSKRVLDYLQAHFQFNTHSLRYACVSYLLNTKHQDVVTVARFIGHNNVNTIIKYCQAKNVEKLYDL